MAPKKRPQSREHPRSIGGRPIIDARPAVAQAVKALRKEQSMTQAAVAKKIGRSPAAVARWENGTRTPDVSDLASLAAIYGVEPGKFFEHVQPQIDEARRFLTRPNTKPTRGRAHARKHEGQE